MRRDWFGLNETKWIRAVCAILIILVHLTENDFFPQNRVTNLIGKTGFIWVGLFFLLSGYGLVRNLLTREKYKVNFLMPHLLRLLVPVYCAELVYLVLDAVIGNYDFRWDKIVVFTNYVSYSWYVVSIGTVYIVFYLSAILTNRYTVEVFCGITLSAYVIFTKIQVSDVYYKGIIGIAIGALLAVIQFKQHLRNMSIFVIAVEILGALLFSICFDSTAVWHAAIVVGIAASLSVGFQYFNPLVIFQLNRLSDISYEMYLVHGSLIMFFIRNSSRGQIAAGLVYLGTILTAYLIHETSKWVSRKLLRLL
ncbi:acyltransferase family protein [Lacticaseibacillus manihotivorans]|uniref:Acyltransferase 3 domain-containing protein n=1 Tax=Lacticaseibacillus manihotivorans DSM 13343 = JCM 12514 TaxID=1423769 RepID=A0A0R1QJD1_9LACO|nr:acyltransferase family protein [Lacticaseibacillus manihotivorans]KRL42213.1 hypothetical protein FD01_GL001963 [Lacticaseibacillus manihotivorans DSM 13343 = JCM 12514]